MKHGAESREQRAGSRKKRGLPSLLTLCARRYANHKLKGFAII